MTQPGNAESTPQALACSVLYTGTDGITHFTQDALNWARLYPGEPEGPHATPWREATGIGFLHLPVGRRSPWHPAPGKRFVMVLRGTMEVVAGDGESRVFDAGDVLLVTDVDGQGHRTNAIGDHAVLAAWVPVS